MQEFVDCLKSFTQEDIVPFYLPVGWNSRSSNAGCFSLHSLHDGALHVAPKNRLQQRKANHIFHKNYSYVASQSTTFYFSALEQFSNNSSGYQGNKAYFVPCGSKPCIELNPRIHNNVRCIVLLLAERECWNTCVSDLSSEHIYSKLIKNILQSVTGAKQQRDWGSNFV